MPKMEILKKIPSNQLRWMEERTEGGNTFFTTSNEIRSEYTLWKKVESGFQRVKVAEDPEEFYKYIE